MRTFVDLGMSPLCERFLAPHQLDEMEPFYPLDVRVCDACLLVQLPSFVTPDEIFGEYAYFSSYSDTWVEHARRFVTRMVDELGLDSTSHVVEVASNDGYLLQHFRTMGIPAVGIEPARNVADVAIGRGIDTVVGFFGVELAEHVARQRRADLVIANNVFAHVPDINDFTAGLAIVLAPRGLLTIEVPHLVRLIEHNEWDTIYHEHFSYYTLLSAERVLAGHGLRVMDVEELASHGGSLRLHVVHADDPRPTRDAVAGLRGREIAAGFGAIEGYGGFADHVMRTKRALLSFLISARDEGATVVGYGAPGKGNTLLNYCGIRTDLIEFTVDRNPYKHGRFTPGTHIPIHPPEALLARRPDYVFILPWNLRREIAAQLSAIREWGGRFVVPIPELEIF